MLQLVQPKLIICDFSVVETVQAALQQLKLDRTIMAFDGSADDVRNIETLFCETDEENFTYEMCNFLRAIQ